MDPQEYKAQGYDSRIKTVTAGSRTSSRVYVPRVWEGKRVMVVLLDPLDE